MKNLLLIPFVCTTALFVACGGGGDGASPVSAVANAPSDPTTITPIALFSTTPQLLPDLKSKYDALCGTNVSVQNAIPANLTGHTDGKKDLIFNLWCSQPPGTVTTTSTKNGIVAFIQKSDGSFIDGTRTLFGVDMVDLIGVGGDSAVFDFNGDGRDDIIFAVTGEDGRALPQGFSGNNRPIDDHRIQQGQ
jgi:hypothetical protein